MSPRRRLLVAAAVVLAVAVSAVLALRALGDRPPANRADQARPGPLLLVPGYGGGEGPLTELAGRLRGAGRTATVVRLPDGGTGDLLTQAETLDAAVRREVDAGAPSVDVIGYSAGGVVARLWVDRYDSGAVARRVVSLGSPLHGTRLAGLGAALGADACPAACRQLTPGSDLLDSLDDSPLPDGLPWLSIWTENDETVQPPHSARLTGAVNVSLQSVCPQTRVSHAELPTHPLVTALVLRAVGTAPLAGPTGCADLRPGG